MISRAFAANSTRSNQDEEEDEEVTSEMEAAELSDLMAQVNKMGVRNKWQDKAHWENNMLALTYLSFSDKFFELAYGSYAGAFDAFIISIIILAGLLVGLQTYPEFSCPVNLSSLDDDRIERDCRNRWGGVHDASSVLLGSGGIVDQVVTWIFVSEFVVKLFANGLAPWNYWIGKDWKWNNFDLTIVLLSFEEVAAVIFSGGSSTIRVLRLFRLARLVKLVGKIPKLQAIVSGLAAGVSSVKYIAILLFLVFYIFAVAGISFFASNDPFHFRTVPVALLSLFRAATLEDWTDIMYINMFGCKKYTSGIYYVEEEYYDKKTGTDIEGAFDDDPFFNSWSEVPAHFRCKQPLEMPYLSSLYWIMFVLINSMVMLSLFVGSVTIAMSESMGDAKVKAEKLKKAKNLMEEELEHPKEKEAQKETMLNIQDEEKVDVDESGFMTKLLTRCGCGMFLAGSEDDFPPDPVMRGLIIKALELSEVNPILVIKLNSSGPNKKGHFSKSMSFKEAISSPENFRGSMRNLQKSFRHAVEKSISKPKFRDRNNYHYGALSRCAVMCRDTSVSPMFSNCVTFCIILAGVTVGMNAQYDQADIDPHGTRNGDASGDIGTIIWFCNTAVNWVFTVEMVLKVIGEDWHPWTYFHSKWNQFDFFIVAASWIPFFLSANGLNSLKLLRLLRLFRILRLIKFLPQLAVIVDSIIHGFDSIAFIAIIMAVVYYMFAILGMMLFEKNDPFHFGYLHRAMLTLFRICTFDDWTDVMYINVYGCKQWGYSDDDSKPHAKICNDTYYTKEVQWNWAAAFYFIIFCVLGALVLLTLFIGVVTTSMEEAYGIAEAKQEAFDRMISNAESRGVKRIACEAFLAAFSRIDEDQSGYASVPELVSGLKSVGFKATAVELRAALRAMPFESKSPEGELDPFEFFLFIIDMAENRPSFFFGGDDEELNPTNAADINPQRVFSRKLDDSDEDSPSNESSNATTPSHEQNHEQAPRHSTAERLSKERDPRLLKSSINKLVEAEKTKRGLSVDRPPDQGQTPKSKGVMFSPSTKPDKPLILIRPGVPGSSI